MDAERADIRLLADAEAAQLYADLALPLAAERPYVVTNTVVTVDGKSVMEGRATPIGSPFDRQLMRRVRAAAEGVLIGAGTLRAEEIEFRLPADVAAARAARGLPPHLIVVVVTARADLPLYRRLFTLETPQVVPVVLTARRANPAALRRLPSWTRVLTVGDEEVDLPAAMAILARDLGLRRAVLEGGPSLNAAMLAHGLVDEVFATLSPKILGGPALTMVAGAAPLPGGLRDLRLISAYGYGSELFLRYRVLHPSP